MRSRHDGPWSVSENRVLAAFALAPLVVPFAAQLIILGAVFLSDRAQVRAISMREMATSVLVVSIFGLPIAYVAELFLGMPAWLVFRRYGIRSLWAFAAGGAIVGCLVYAIMTLRDVESLGSRFEIVWNPTLAICVLGASAAAVTFRAILVAGSGHRSYQLGDSK
jgi:hypothetical protein